MNDNIDNAYSFSRVPEGARVNLANVTLVRIGMATALSQFMLGATLGHGMSFWQAMLATLLGSLVLECISFGLGLAGMREGLSTSLLARYCGFGSIGSIFISATVILSLLGWFGIQNSVLADGLVRALDYNISFRWGALFSGVVLTILVAFGFKALSITAKVSVPLFFFVMAWITYPFLRGDELFTIVNLAPTGNPISLSEGTTIISGVVIIGALITPDLSRYCKSKSHVFWMITISVIIGGFFINSIAILIAHVLGTSDIITIINHSAGWIGFISIVLSAIKVNDVNLYSSSLGLSNLIEAFSGNKYSYFWITIFLGAIGTTLSVVGILTHFVNFLVIIGVLFPPIAGVMLVDYYILRTHRNSLDYTRVYGLLPDSKSVQKVGWPAIAAWAVGSIIGFVINEGIPSLNSLFSASVTYWSLCIVIRNFSSKRKHLD